MKGIGKRKRELLLLGLICRVLTSWAVPDVV